VSGLELIVAALAAGASAGVSNTATAAVQDAYGALKGLLTQRLSGRDQAQQALQTAETTPGVWQTLLGEHLTASGAADDERVLVAAHRLLTLLDPPAAATFRVDLREAKGVQVGDHNTQHNTF